MSSHDPSRFTGDSWLDAKATEALAREQQACAHLEKAIETASRQKQALKLCCEVLQAQFADYDPEAQLSGIEMSQDERTARLNAQRDALQIIHQELRLPIELESSAWFRAGIYHVVQKMAALIEWEEISREESETPSVEWMREEKIALFDQVHTAARSILEGTAAVAVAWQTEIMKVPAFWYYHPFCWKASLPHFEPYCTTTVFLALPQRGQCPGCSQPFVADPPATGEMDVVQASSQRAEGLPEKQQDHGPDP